MTKTSIFSTLLREPLFHFLLIGAGLFFLFSQMNPAEDTTEKIIITKAKIQTLANDFAKIKGRLPTPAEMQTQIKYDIREQVLYREAIAIGLDKEDMVIRNRLAQQMKYIFNDLSLIEDPSDMELEAFIEDNPSKFTAPAILSFSQVYLDPKKHTNSLDEDAARLLEKLQTTTRNDIRSFGDHTLLPYVLNDKNENTIKGMFGDAFVKEALKMSTNKWQGPIHSTYGVHLIYIHKKNASQLQPLHEIRARVEQEWMRVQEEIANELFYQSLYKNYEIIVDDEVLKDANISSIKI